MKFIQSQIIALLLCLLIQPLNAFEVGTDAQILQRRVVNGAVAADMLVGENMRVSRWDFCTNAGRLMLAGFARPADVSEYWAEYVATMINGGRVSVTVSTDHMRNPDRGDVTIRLRACTDSNINEFTPVNDINGFRSLQAFLDSDFVTSLPRP